MSSQIVSVAGRHYQAAVQGAADADHRFAVQHPGGAG